MKLKPKSSDARLIIGFDTEWVKEQEPPDLDDPDAEDDDPAPPLRNTILSYQFACRFIPGEDELTPEREWSGIIYTRHAHAILHPDASEAALAAIPERVKFADLLGQAITKGIELGKIHKWPKEVIATGPAPTWLRWPTMR